MRGKRELKGRRKPEEEEARGGGSRGVRSRKQEGKEGYTGKQVGEEK